MLDIDTVTTIYYGRRGSVVALEAVSLRVGPGEFVAVQGASGCGKTTLLLTAGGLLVPDEGTVEINGIDMYRLPSDERALYRASQIGFVFQQFHLVPYLNVLENVLVPSVAMRDKEAENRAHGLLERLNMTGRLHHVPSELSTGERQRTAMARALLNKPRLLLADEPTGNLDSDNAEIILSVFEEFTRTGGAVLLVTHDEIVGKAAHRTIKLRDGKVITDRRKK
ncbi:ABC transporter ATP-binding protein [bacterium]|nr:ABC transporter ATP-binding protein [bacterium]